MNEFGDCKFNISFIYIHFMTTPTTIVTKLLILCLLIAQGVDKSIMTQDDSGEMVEEWLDLNNGCLCCTVK